MSPIKYFLITFILCFITETSVLFAQEADNNTKVKALNNYVNFSNESTHGMFLVQRMLDQNNKLINQFVNLPSQTKFEINNSDFSLDVFNEEMYYTSVNRKYELMSKSGEFLGQENLKLKGIADKILQITKKANNLRFEIEELIKSLDLSKRENISKVYDLMEVGVTLFKEYHALTNELMHEVEIYQKKHNLFPDSNIKHYDVYLLLKEIHVEAKKVLNDLYKKDDENLSTYIESQKLKLNKLTQFEISNQLSSQGLKDWNSLKSNYATFINLQTKFLDSENIPENHKIYDKFYYYYNYPLIPAFSRIGPGLSQNINDLYNKLFSPVVNVLDAPPYFKVIYPKILDKTEFLASSDPVIKALPKTVKGRSVVTATRSINVDSFIVDLQMYDHKIVDRDIVSLSFNGDWIVEKYSLTEKPYNFTLKLNEEGKNFLLLHADDMGRQPPATIALSYKYKGKKQLIILNSDTVKSEVIEIIVQ